MSKEIDLIIPIGTELFYTGDNTDYFTKGKGYKIRKHAIEYVIDDNHEGNHHWNESILDTFSITKEETTPIYWKEGDPIKVGDKILVKGKSYTEDFYTKSEILFVGRDVFVYAQEDTDEHECYGVMAEHDFKPIDSRSDKQKLDDALDQFSYKKETWTHMSFTEAVDLGHIPYLEYTGEK